MVQRRSIKGRKYDRSRKIMVIPSEIINKLLFGRSYMCIGTVLCKIFTSKLINSSGWMKYTMLRDNLGRGKPNFNHQNKMPRWNEDRRVERWRDSHETSYVESNQSISHIYAIVKER